MSEAIQVREARPLEDPSDWLGLIARGTARFFLLAALGGRPLHGYQLSRAIAEACGGCCEPSDAMIYPAIRELEEGGYIVCNVESQGARQRRVCALTERGRNAYRAAAEAWSAVLPFLQASAAAGLQPDPAQVEGEDHDREDSGRDQAGCC